MIAKYLLPKLGWQVFWVYRLRETDQAKRFVAGPDSNPHMDANFFSGNPGYQNYCVDLGDLAKLLGGQNQLNTCVRHIGAFHPVWIGFRDGLSVM